MVFAKKKWGQNFLVDNNLLEKIIKTIDIKKDDEILEIGPGHGALSEKIIQKTKSLKMVEIDPELIQVISQNPLLSPFEIFNQDILKTNLQELGLNNPKVIGNIPYNITSPIIFWLIDHLPYWSESYLMVQKEVAQRLYAKVGTKFYSRTSVLIQANASVKEKFEVRAENFFPRPKVNSSVIEIIPSRRREFNYESLDKILKISFLHRRKILKNNLKNLSIEVQKKINESGINLSSRPQNLKPDEYIKLSKILFC